MRSCSFFVECSLSGSAKFLLIVFCLLLILRRGGGKDYGVGEKLEQKKERFTWKTLPGRVKITRGIDMYARLKWNLRRERLQRG